MTPRPLIDLLVQADYAERNGDHGTAAAKLRAHLTTHADQGAVRLKLARLLLKLEEQASARAVLLPLDDATGGWRGPVRGSGGDGDGDGMGEDWARQANRLLAMLDESEGALTSAQVRWERVLADDIDDAEARSRLLGLRQRIDPGWEGGERADGALGGPSTGAVGGEAWPATLALGTLASPEGVRLSRFKMVRELGRGSTAAVYLVLDERLNLPLALKVLHPQMAAAVRAELRQKFFAEARLAARLRHPGVVAIYGVDEAARYLAMEYVAGGTIRDRVRASTRQPGAGGVASSDVMGIARSLFAALAYVHGAGIVHGDLKPGNVLLREPTQVVLADFGMAALGAAALGIVAPGETSATTTRAATSEHAAGTPMYLAPEQFRGARPSVHTDLFATGAILWELLTGRPLRRQADLLAGIYAVAVSAEAARGAPPTLVRLISSLLSGDAAGRPASAADALAQLDRA